MIISLPKCIQLAYGLVFTRSPSEAEQQAAIDFFAEVRHCMERLPERLRRIFSPREIDDLPVPEAAAACVTASGAVLLTRAPHQLRACLQRHQVTP